MICFLADERVEITISPKIIKIADSIVTVVVILAVVLLVSHIVVCGRQIDGVSEMTDTNCTVTITTYQHMEQKDAMEHELGPEKILKLKTLILSSNFYRGLARTKEALKRKEKYADEGKDNCTTNSFYFDFCRPICLDKSCEL